MRERIIHAAASLLLAAMLLRGAVGEGVRVGVATSEAAGRVFVSAQVWRWLRGDAMPGHADLLAWPDGQSFWPVDPLVQIVEAPMQAGLGPDLAFTLVVGLLLALSTYATARLTRAVGGGAASALVAGMAVTLSPFMLRNLRDAVTEALAVGIAAIAIGATHRVLRDSSRASLSIAAAAVLALATSSPYYVVYLAIGWAMVTPFFARRSSPELARLAVVSAAACALAAAPLVVIEGSDGGRLGSSWRGGYHLAPAALVHQDGRPADRTKSRAREATAAGPSFGSGFITAPLERGLRRVPGGAALLLIGVGSLAHRRARPWAAIALVLLVLGPGPGIVLRSLGTGVPPSPSVLQRMLEALPLTGAMGNPERVLGAWSLLAAVAGGIALRNRPLLLGLSGALVVATAELEQPRLLTPATRVTVPATVLASAHGAMVVFPTGDPPAWHPQVSPKEALALAARADVPVAYDYGRGHMPADLLAVVRLAQIGRVALSDQAWQAADRVPPDTILWPALSFHHVLLLEDRLALQQRQHLRKWLEQNASVLAESPGVSLWSWPAPATTTPQRD